ncbi:hypothetical protein BGZ52_006694, partial [Haplosporangium bisporale]
TRTRRTGSPGRATFNGRPFRTLFSMSRSTRPSRTCTRLKSKKSTLNAWISKRSWRSPLSIEGVTPRRMRAGNSRSKKLSTTTVRVSKFLGMSQTMFLLPICSMLSWEIKPTSATLLCAQGRFKRCTCVSPKKPKQQQRQVV